MHFCRLTDAAKHQNTSIRPRNSTPLIRNIGAFNGANVTEAYTSTRKLRNIGAFEGVDVTEFYSGLLVSDSLLLPSYLKASSIGDTSHN